MQPHTVNPQKPNAVPSVIYRKLAKQFGAFHNTNKKEMETYYTNRITGNCTKNQKKLLKKVFPHLCIQFYSPQLTHNI